MKWVCLILALWMSALSAQAQGLAQLDLGASSLTKTGRGWFGRPAPLELRLGLTSPVAYRVYIVGDPARLIVDLKGVETGDVLAQDMFGADLVPAIRWGRYRRGWSRLVMELPGPYRIENAGQRTSGARPGITIALDPVSEAEFAPRASAATALRNLPDPAELPELPADEGLVVALDPGHGGFDPGAEAGGEKEADLVLDFARELRTALEARGIGVVMTRDADQFVRLEQRMTIARDGGADLLLSLHADALPEGQAAGATVYLWNSGANRRATQQLALRHDRDDLLRGQDFSGTDDALTGVLMDFARTDTQPRSENFARFLTSRLALMGIGLHGRPVQAASFSVLKSPDIPSALLELGFISDEVDRANLTDPRWRARMVEVIAESIQGWARDEAARASMLRR